MLIGQVLAAVGGIMFLAGLGLFLVSFRSPERGPTTLAEDKWWKPIVDFFVKIGERLFGWIFPKNLTGARREQRAAGLFLMLLAAFLLLAGWWIANAGDNGGDGTTTTTTTTAG